MSEKNVGFIGLGNMGFGMAENLLNMCGALLVWNRSQPKIDKIGEKGATDAGSAEQIAKQCDVIVLSLPGPKEVRAVVGEILIPNGKAGQWILDTSTIDPKSSRDIEKAAKEKGIIYIDCPVSGGKVGAEKGTLTFMIGSTKEQAAPVMSYLRCMGKTHYFMGKPGGGSAIKIINNFMSFSAAVISAEAVNMAEHMDIPLTEFFDVVMASSGGNNYLKSKASKILASDIEASFTVKLVLKDLELAADLCRDANIPNFTGNAAIQWFRLASKCGYEDKDSSSLVNLFRDIVGSPH